MKGIIFTEFLEMLEKSHGDLFTDKLIVDCDLESEGSYTTVGNYPSSELFKLIATLSNQTNTEQTVLIHTFASYLFQTFATKFSVFFENISSSFDLLKSVDNHIHVEVKKLYPDAKLPRFYTKLIDDHHLRMEYTSSRPLAELALGLINATITHYNEDITVKRTYVDDQHSNHVIFDLTKCHE